MKMNSKPIIKGCALTLTIDNEIKNDFYKD